MKYLGVSVRLRAGIRLRVGKGLVRLTVTLTRTRANPRPNPRPKPRPNPVQGSPTGGNRLEDGVQHLLHGRIGPGHPEDPWGGGRESRRCGGLGLGRKILPLGLRRLGALSLILTLTPNPNPNYDFTLKH